MYDCFISYSRKDKHVAVMVQSILEQHGIKCWIDYRDALAGEKYAGSIVRAIKSVKLFVILISANSAVSTHVLNEINVAVNAGVTILPFKIDDCQISDSMEYYLGGTHWLDALTPPIEAHINKLVEIVKKYVGTDEIGENSQALVIEKKPQRASSECIMMKYEDLLSLGYTSKSIALQLVENDYINCNGIGLENEGTAEQWEEYLQDNSDTFQYLINGENKIVGDWSIVALNEESMELAMKGELLESDIDLDRTELICFAGIYNGYILTFSILPEYRNMKNYNLLIESFIDQIEEYSENGIFFKTWCINVFSREVESLVRQLGFKYIVDNKVHGKIYSCEFMPLPNHSLLKKRQRLQKNYKEFWDEYEKR